MHFRMLHLLNCIVNLLKSSTNFVVRTLLSQMYQSKKTQYVVRALSMQAESIIFVKIPLNGNYRSVIPLQQYIPLKDFDAHALSIMEHLIAKQLTTASRYPSAPLTVGHAGTSAVSLQGVPSVTGVGHCGSICCTRDILLTICRSFGGRSTADSCREDTVTAFL